MAGLGASIGASSCGSSSSSSSSSSRSSVRTAAEPEGELGGAASRVSVSYAARIVRAPGLALEFSLSALPCEDQPEEAEASLGVSRVASRSFLNVLHAELSLRTPESRRGLGFLVGVALREKLPERIALSALEK